MIHPYQIDLLTIGDELLLGIRDNAHLVYLGKQLANHGLTLRRNEVIRDTTEEISRFFTQSWADADILITTGGLGPTTDDITRETVAAALGRKLVHHPPSEAALRERFAKLGRTPTANNFRQCYLVEGAEAIPNRYGTAPGQWLRHGHQLLIMLPGPGSEMRPMWEEQVVPRLQAEKILGERAAYVQLRTLGLGESQLETNLRPIFDRFPGRLLVGYCAHNGMVEVRLSPVGHSLSWEEVRAIGEECREKLGDDFVCYGDCCLASLLLRQLRGLNATLAVAESCTGGLLAAAFTDVPGASKVFLGGLVCYSNDAKVQLLDVPEPILQQHGPVSAECAVALATGAAEKFGSDYALAVTGFAGPTGGTAENPVGTIYFGLSSPTGAWAHRAVYPGNRLQVRERAVNMALDWMRRKLHENRVHDLLEILKC